VGCLLIACRLIVLRTKPHGTESGRNSFDFIPLGCHRSTRPGSLFYSDASCLNCIVRSARPVARCPILASLSNSDSFPMRSYYNRKSAIGSYHTSSVRPGDRITIKPSNGLPCCPTTTVVTYCQGNPRVNVGRLMLKVPTKPMQCSHRTCADYSAHMPR
jgi:sulfur relay (sulfurtransferase) DsrF/TusC family protein